MGAALELKGRRFGQLTAVQRMAPVRRTAIYYGRGQRDPANLHHAMWLCRCSCGNTCIEQATKLVIGRVTHCPFCDGDGVQTREFARAPT